MRGRALLLAVMVLAACSSEPADVTVPTTAPRTVTRWQLMAEAPIAGRIAAGTVWTGTEMLVWGGIVSGGQPTEAADGAAYDPATDMWRTLAPAPPGVAGSVDQGAAWTGKEAVFWAGNSPDGPAVGAIYDPAADTWRRLDDAPLGPREGDRSVWTGTELLLIGGAAGDTMATPIAAAVNPATGHWRLLPGLNAIRGLQLHGAVWDGTRVMGIGQIALCVELDSRCQQFRPVFVSYDPAIDRGEELPLDDAPGDPSQLVARAWTGEEVVFTSDADTRPIVARYHPGERRWATTSSGLCDLVGEDRAYSQTAWIGDRMVFACGDDRLQVWDPTDNRWTSLPVGPSPMNSRSWGSVVWTGTELLAWSGTVFSPGNPTPADGARLALDR